MRDVLERDPLTVAEGQDPVTSYTLKQLPGREPLPIFDIPRELYHASVFKNWTNGDEHPIAVSRPREAKSKSGSA